jgi:hypothetical protein
LRQIISGLISAVARKEQTVSRSQNNAIADEVLSLVLDTAQSILDKPAQPSASLITLLVVGEAGPALDQTLDAEHAPTVRVYTERRPQENRPPQKAVIAANEPNKETRNRHPQCGSRGVPIELDMYRPQTLDVRRKHCCL